MSYKKRNLNYAKSVLVIASDCADYEKEQAYNAWFETMLIPKFQELDFVGDAHRYTNVYADTPLFAGRPKYLALIDVHSDNLYDAFAQIRGKEAELKAEGKYFSEHTPVYNTVFEKFTDPFIMDRLKENPVQGVYMVMHYCADPAQEDVFNEWYTYTHGPDTCKCGNWDSVVRYKLVDPKNPGWHQPPYMSIYETAIDPLEARKNQGGFGWMWQDDRIWCEVLQLNYTGAFRHIGSLTR